MCIFDDMDNAGLRCAPDYFTRHVDGAVPTCENGMMVLNNCERNLKTILSS